MKKKPIYKRWWFWVIAIIFIVGTLGNLGEDSTTTVSNNVEASASGKDSDKEKQANKDEKATKIEDNAPQLVAIGEELQVGDVIFKVNKVSTSKKIKDGEFFFYEPSSEGSEFYIVNATVKNVGKEMINTDSSFFELKNGEISYSPTTLITTSGDFFLFEGINPGLSKTGNVAFEVPEGNNDFVLTVQTGFWGTEQGEIKLK